MNLLNTRVMHKTLGCGIVRAQNESRITVEFSSKTCTFEYPEAFRKYLMTEKATDNEVILSEIAANDEKIAKEKQKVEEERKAEEEKRLEELARKSKNRESEKLTKRIHPGAIILLH